MAVGTIVRRTARLGGVAILVVLAGCIAAATGDPPEPSDAAEILALVNEVRAEGATCGTTAYGPVPPLRRDARLERAATRHSEDMAAAGAMGHATPEGAIHYRPGTTPAQRAEIEGYFFAAFGENVAFGATRPADVMRLWLGSPGHCANILNDAFEELGVGRAGSYWTQNFGRRP